MAQQMLTYFREEGKKRGYTDAQIAAASEDVKGKTELEATIAYLQVLGLALK